MVDVRFELTTNDPWSCRRRHPSPWAHLVPGIGAKTRPTSRPREPRPLETQRRQTPPQQESSVSHQARLNEEIDRILSALGGSGWTASHCATR